MHVVVMSYIWIGRSWIFFYFLYVRYCGTACVYLSFRWDPFVHSLGIVQWNSTRRDHPGNPGGVSGSGLVKDNINCLGNEVLVHKSAYLSPMG